MKIKLIISLSLAVFLAGCSSLQLQRAQLALGVVSNDLRLIAGKIDAGVEIAKHDLPLACRITEDVSAFAHALVDSGVVREKTRFQLAKAAEVAAALASSDLCQRPATNPLTASFQIIRAVRAIRQAAASTMALSATAVVSGMRLPPR